MVTAQRPALIFDLDGTLIHSAPDIHAVANAILAEHGKAPLDLATVTGFIGKGVPWLVHCLVRETGLDPALEPAIVEEFEARYDAAVNLTNPYPGVPEALEALKAAGHRLAVCTNKPISPARAVLEHVGLLDLFDHVQGGDMLPVKKPDPAPLHAVMEALGADTGSTLYIGDSETDAETAHRAQLPFLIYTEGYRKTPISALPHDVAFSDWSELPGLIARMAEAA